MDVSEKRNMDKILMNLILENQSLMAVKHYRSVTGASLRDALDYIDKLRLDLNGMSDAELSEKLNSDVDDSDNEWGDDLDNWNEEEEDVSETYFRETVVNVKSGNTNPSTFDYELYNNSNRESATNRGRDYVCTEIDRRSSEVDPDSERRENERKEAERKREAEKRDSEKRNLEKRNAERKEAERKEVERREEAEKRDSERNVEQQKAEQRRRDDNRMSREGGEGSEAFKILFFIGAVVLVIYFILFA